MRTLVLLFLLVGILIMSSCDDIIEKRLNGQTVNILAPSNGVTLPSTSVTFWWEVVKGATKYNVQVVKPSFASIQFLIADSMVTGDKFTLNVQPGSYEWRIKALNSSSQTDFFTFSFTIDSSLNLSNQSVQLISPVNNYISKQFNQTFSWSPVFYSDDYRFEILSSTGGSIFLNAALSNTTISYTFTNDGTYNWRVRAQNGSSVSNYSQSTILIDQTVPATPAPISPADNAIVHNPFMLSWSQATDLGSPIFDSLYIFANLNQDTLIKAIRPPNTSYTDSLALGDYFWKLRSIDSAGNYSSYTSLYKFIIQ